MRFCKGFFVIFLFKIRINILRFDDIHSLNLNIFSRENDYYFKGIGEICYNGFGIRRLLRRWQTAYR
jgi:hypothetical protein